MSIYRIKSYVRLDSAEKEVRSNCAFCGDYSVFNKAFALFCLSIVRGYEIEQSDLNDFRSKTASSLYAEIAVHYGLELVRISENMQSILLKNEQTVDGYCGDNHLVSVKKVSPEEASIMTDHQINIEEDYAGKYFELYPLYDLVYDLCDFMEKEGDPLNEEMMLLLIDYLSEKELLTNEIDPAEDGYFCPGTGTPEECFAMWGASYGYETDEKELFTSNLVPYKHGYVLEFRE